MPASDLLRRHVSQIEQDIRRLSALRDELRGMLSAMPGQDCPDPLPGTWCPPGYRMTGKEVMTMCECCGTSSCDGSCCDAECC